MIAEVTRRKAKRMFIKLVYYMDKNSIVYVLQVYKYAFCNYSTMLIENDSGLVFNM